MEKTRMPVLFVGHGSPMNAIQDTEFARGWAAAAASFPKPERVLCVSAHWLTRGSSAASTAKPETIHDFGGFPRELYEVQYPAPGDPALAERAAKAVLPTEASLDDSWGLDHGAWSVLRWMYPDADVPIAQFSVDIGRNGAYHLELGARLAALRDEGTLIVASGNVVHNLGEVAWDKLDGKAFGYDWALEFDAEVKKRVLAGKDDELADWESLGKAARLSVPFPDHYYPLLYVLGARSPDEPVSVFNEAAVGGSLTMTSYRFG